MSLHLDYFYGIEEKQYHFFRFPKLLLTDLRYKTIPTEAKVLYSLLLDRMTLSMRNGWLDDQGRVFLYFSLEEAMEQLNCGKDKAIRLFKALDVTTGVGLIERHKQGQGRPTKIYVKNFIPTEQQPADQQPPAQATPGQAGLMSCEQAVTAQRSATATPPMPCKQIATEQHVYIPSLSAPRKQAAMPRKRAASARRRIPPTPSMLRAMAEQQAAAEQSAVAPSISSVTAQSSFTPPKQVVKPRKQAPSARRVPTPSVLQAQVVAEQSAIQSTSVQPVLPSFVPHTPEPAKPIQQEGQKAGMTTQEELLRQIAENQKKNMALLLEKLGFLTSVNPVFQTSGKPNLIILKGMIRKRIKLRKWEQAHCRKTKRNPLFRFHPIHLSHPIHPFMNEHGVSNKAWIITVKLSEKISNMNTY